LEIPVWLAKNVYVEKQIANTIEECQIMVKAQESAMANRQVGFQWQRSGFAIC